MPINAKVRVNQAISHPCHGVPIDLRVRIDDFGWKCLRCLPDNLEASSKRSFESCASQVLLA